MRTSCQNFSNRMEAARQYQDKYKRISILGQGAFGRAFLCERKNPLPGEEGPCVIKEIDTAQMRESEIMQVITEARNLSSMNHPNIVRFIEVFETVDHKICLVMDFADRGDLNKIITDYQPNQIPEPYILAWFVQIAMALNHVHSLKVIHRDVKTSNIFITSSGVIKLGDFGISRILEGTREFAHSLVGTPYYLAPEIISEKPYSFKADVWSLGVVLYELMVGSHPFRGDSLHALAVEILKGNYKQPPTSYSDSLRGLLSTLLAKDPSERPTVLEILHLPFLKPYILAAAQVTGHNPLGDAGSNSVTSSSSKPQQQQPQISNNVNTAASTAGPARSTTGSVISRMSLTDEEGLGASVSAPPLIGTPAQKVSILKSHILKSLTIEQLNSLLSTKSGESLGLRVIQQVGDPILASKLAKQVKVLAFLMKAAIQQQASG